MQQYSNVPNLLNYKNIKCFYYERDNYCRYGTGCQYAHLDSEIKTPMEIAYLNSVASTMNYQLNNGYVEGGSLSIEETQNRVNSYMQTQSMMNGNNFDANNNYGYNNYDYNAYNNYPNNTQDNQYDYSYTPDTNYGDSEVNSNVYYDANNSEQSSTQYSQYPQYAQYSQYQQPYDVYLQNTQADAHNLYNYENYAYDNSQANGKIFHFRFIYILGNYQAISQVSQSTNSNIVRENINDKGMNIKREENLGFTKEKQSFESEVVSSNGNLKNVKKIAFEFDKK